MAKRSKKRCEELPILHPDAADIDVGASELSNGELLRAAEESVFENFLTTDKNIRYQQNLADGVIAIVVLGNSRWPVVQLYVDRIVAAITAAKAGTYTEVEIPDR